MAELKPNVNYTWDEKSTFTLSGKQFELFINGLRATLATPESQKVLMLNELSNILNEVLSRGIDEGTIKEIELPTAPSPMKIAE